MADATFRVVDEAVPSDRDGSNLRRWFDGDSLPLRGRVSTFGLRVREGEAEGFLDRLDGVVERVRTTLLEVEGVVAGLPQTPTVRRIVGKVGRALDLTRRARVS